MGKEDNWGLDVSQHAVILHLTRRGQWEDACLSATLLRSQSLWQKQWGEGSGQKLGGPEEVLQATPPLVEFLKS